MYGINHKNVATTCAFFAFSLGVVRHKICVIPKDFKINIIIMYIMTGIIKTVSWKDVMMIKGGTSRCSHPRQAVYAMV